MPARRFPITPAAIAEAARFIAQGARRYTRAGEPAHPSLRQVAAHLVARGLVDQKPAAATLARALARAGVVLPSHWRSGEVNISPPAPEVNISVAKQVGAPPSLCSSVDDGGSVSPPARRPRPRPRPDHPWRRPLVAAGGAP